MTRKQKQRILNWIWRIAFMILVILVMSIIGNQQSIMVMQTDTLNTLDDMRQEQDELQTQSEMLPAETIYSLTPDERDLVERVVAAESRGEDMQGQMAVANVILDRAELWGMTPAEVVQAPGQFADPFPGEISDSIHLAVANVFDGGIRIFEEPTTHFASGGEPWWAEDKVNRGSIGCHKFYY